MTEKDLLYALDGVDDVLLQEALEAGKRKPLRTIRAIAATAACLALCMGGLYLRFGWRMGSSMPPQAAPCSEPLSPEAERKSGAPQPAVPDPVPREEAPSAEPTPRDSVRKGETLAGHRLGGAALGCSEAWAKLHYGRPVAQSNEHEFDPEGLERWSQWYGEDSGLRLDLVRPADGGEAVVSGIYLTGSPDAWPGLADETGAELRLGEPLGTVLEQFPQQDKTAIGDCYTVPLDEAGQVCVTFFLADRQVSAIYLGEVYPRAPWQAETTDPPEYAMEGERLTLWHRADGQWLSRELFGWQQTKYLITVLNIEELRFDGEAAFPEEEYYVDFHNGTVIGFAFGQGEEGCILRVEGGFVPGGEAELLHDGVEFPQGSRAAAEALLGE